LEVTSQDNARAGNCARSTNRVGAGNVTVH
jgi:hypothetical protein